MSRVRYMIYPSLLDKFQAFVDSDIESEGFWNIDHETGEMKQTPDEIATKNEQALLDSINRKPCDPIEAADKGTCFNEVIDVLISGEKCQREDIEIDFGYIDGLGGFTHESDGFCTEVIRAQMNGFTFLFDAGLCREAAEYFGEGAISQHFCKGRIMTAYGEVELYGYLDEVVKDVVYDIKTTSQYSFGKFERAWQKEVYPYCLVQSGEMPSVKQFEFVVFQLSKPSSRTPFIKGTRYSEVYTYDHTEAEKSLRAILERFIEWLEANRERITDLKIFGLNSKRNPASEQAYDEMKAEQNIGTPNKG